MHNSILNLNHDSSGRITHRYTSLGYSDYTYEDGTDWLVRETWHSAISGNAFDLVRYSYVNGRPTRMETPGGPWDLTEPWGYYTRYLQYNWHGDAVTFFVLDGAGDWITSVYNPWGENMGSAYRWQYYRWNGAWGYLYVEDLGLFYAHGRWYNPDTGMWLSPNAKGDYMYGGDGQDAVNYALTPVGLFQQQANGVTLDHLTSMAALEYALLKYAGHDPIARLHARSIASQIAAYVAVGEIDTFCGGRALLNNEEAAIRKCKQAFGPVIATALNRYNCIAGIPGYLNCDNRATRWKYYGDVLSNTPDEDLKTKSQTERAELLAKRAQNATLGRILLGGCAGASCSQYSALSRWIDPSRRDHLGFDIGNDYDRAVRPIQYRIARELAWSIFSGDSTFGSGIIGKRTDFLRFSNETEKKVLH